jgi:vancomycin resistance protein YoaR
VEEGTSLVRRFSARFIVVLAAAALGIALYGACRWNQAWQGRIYPGVRLEGIGLGGLTEQEAEQKLESVRDELLASKVKLVLGDHVQQVSRKDLGFQLDPVENARLAMMVGRSGPAWERPRKLWQAFYFQVDTPLKVTLDSDSAKSVLQAFAKGLYTPPQNAQLVVNDAYQVKIIEGKPGKVLDLDASVKALAQDTYPFDGVMSLRLVDQQPQVSTQDVLGMKVTGLLASYTTYFDTSSVNRTYNVNVAADALDHSLVKPGDVFSFNRVVGPRSEEAGYKEALVIEQNKFIPGIGGGVCQVSSTLYNSVLLAGLQIVERSNHSLPVTYVPLGRDATVAYGSYDLRFRNNTGGYLYIKTRAGGGVLAIAILGNTAEKKKVELETDVDKVLDFKVVTKNDPSLYQGKTLVETEGVKGYQVRAYRMINGVRTLLSDDVYAPVDKIVHVGTMPVPETPPPPGNQQQPAPSASTAPTPTPAPATGAPGQPSSGAATPSE